MQADGNCGYRAIAALLGHGEHSWAQIRIDLLRELQQCHAFYVQLFGTVDRVRQLINSLLIDGINTASPDKWMTIPDMGYIIATRYNIALVHLSTHGCITFFPLRGRPPLNDCSPRVKVIGFVHNCHFVQVLSIF